jgi:hypothetical protein
MQADEIGQLDKAINELAKMMDQIVDNMMHIQNAMGNVIGVLGTIPNAVDALKKMKGEVIDIGGDDGHGS